MDNKAIAKRFGKRLPEISNLIAELEEARVFDRLEDGTIISRRMFSKSQKKEHISTIRSRAGEKGMANRWAGADNKSITKGDNKKITNITASSPTPTPPPTSTPKDLKKERREFNSSDVSLTKLLIQRMLENDEKAKVPEEDSKEFDTWINQIRLCRERDKRTEKEITEALEFSQSEGFWIPNIHSTKKLRDKIPTLLQQSRRNAEGAYKPSQIGRTPQAELDKDPIPTKLWEHTARIIASRSGDVPEFLQKKCLVFDDQKNIEKWKRAIGAKTRDLNQHAALLIRFVESQFTLKESAKKASVVKCSSCGSIVSNELTCASCGEEL